jgi:hypothetical protein
MQRDPKLFGNDASQRGLAESRWPTQEDMIERVAAPPRCLDEDPEVLLVLLLSDEVVELRWAKNPVEALFFVLNAPRQDPAV